MITTNTILNKCRIFRLRQFQGQNYLIGRMTASSISAPAAEAWLLFDGGKCIGEIAMLLCLRLERPFNVVHDELLKLAQILVRKGALTQTGEVPIGVASGEIAIEDTRLPAALLWGGY